MKFFAILLVALVIFVAVVEAAKPGTKKPIKKPVTATAFTTCSSDNMCQQSNANKRSICKYELVEGQDSYCTICVALPSIKAHINSKKPNNTCGVCDGAKVCRTAHEYAHGIGKTHYGSVYESVPCFASHLRTRVIVSCQSWVDWFFTDMTCFKW